MKPRFLAPYAVVWAALLAGCSALQVDVDVYKGALLNQKEVQQRQYAYLAISAKPMIERLRQQATQELQACAKTCDRQEALQQAEAFLLEVLQIYGGTNADLKAVQSAAAEERGIDALTKALANAYAMPSEKPAEKDLRQRKVDAATARLNEVLIYFAQRILFMVNHETLFQKLGPAQGDNLQSYKSVLQSLANTLLVHANDLQRQAERELLQGNRARIENAAIERAFRVTPALTFDRLAAQFATLPAAARPVSAPEAPEAPDPHAEAKRRLTALELNQKSEQDSHRQYQEGLAGLIAAVQTLQGDARKLVPGLVAPLSATESRAQAQDRQAIAALYPARPADDNDRTELGALAPLRTWLERERSASVAVERKQRLARALAHLEADKSRLLADVAQATLKSELLTMLQRRLDQDLSLASSQLADHAAQAQRTNQAVQNLRQEIRRLDNGFEHARQAAAKVQTSSAEADKVKAVLAHVRPTVLAQADAAKVTDAAGVHALLKHELAGLLTAPGSGAPPREHIALTLDKVSALRAPVGTTCAGLQTVLADDPVGTDACAGPNQMDVVDSLIASLRAQRVQALASGNDGAAADLLAAINAAYDQRTAMIYLRPASDYLRSVHSASDLQEAAEPQFRNMLNDWWRYLKPNLMGNNDGDEARRKLELEKLYWQNINRVTLGGGGATNFVVAKDDVGNWYVKAYGSDPEAIFKSATQLAMFNAGSRLNVNLMQRYNLQSQLDTSTDSGEKERLGAQLDRLDSQDGRPLLALQTRYARQYADNTLQTGARLHQQLAMLATGVSQLVETATGRSDTCRVADLQRGLEGLDKQWLEPPRGQLGTLLSNPGAAEPVALVISYERVIQAALTALHLYGGKVYQALDESPAANCDAAWRRGVAQRARDLASTALLGIARERRSTVERYEDALVNITEVATQK